MHPLRDLPLVILLALGLTGTIPSQQPDSPPAAPPPRPLVLKVQTGLDKELKTAEVSLEVASPEAETTLDQVVPLGEGLPPLRVKRYLPSAALTQDVVPDPGPEGKPSLLLGVVGPKQSHQLWLIAADPKRNRLTSLIGTWCVVSAPDAKQRDESFRSFQDALRREPKLTVRVPGQDQSRELAAKAGATLKIEDPACTVKVLKFFPHFVMGEKQQPANQSERPVNPAALVSIERDGTAAERWVFTRMPDFGKDPSDQKALDIILDCPIVAEGASTDFCLAIVEGARVELWTRGESGCTSMPLETGAKVPVPNSRYTFQVDQVVASGRLLESYAPAVGRPDVKAVVQVETTDADGKTSALWLPLGMPQAVTTAAGPVMLTFQRRLPDLPPGHPAGR